MDSTPNLELSLKCARMTSISTNALLIDSYFETTPGGTIEKFVLSVHWWADDWQLLREVISGDTLHPVSRRNARLPIHFL
jgi:hypothetical protein